MGDVFSAANVLGVDLSPIQPEWVPPNVRFMVDDIEYVSDVSESASSGLLTPC